MTETMATIGIIILTVVYFIVFNKIFDVYYFGFRGIGGTIIGCLVAAIFTIGLVFEFWMWIVGIGVIIAIFRKLGQKA